MSGPLEGFRVLDLSQIVSGPFASLLFLMTLGTFAVSLVELADPRGRWNRVLHWLGPYEVPLSVLFLGFMAASWVYKTWLMGLLIAS